MIALSVAKLKMFSPESEIFLWIKPKKKRKNFFVESLEQCRRSEVREKARNVFCVEPTSVWQQDVTQHRIFIKYFSISLGFSRFFRSYFVLQILEFKEFNKTIIPFALVGYETGYVYLPSHIVRARSWNNCKIIKNWTPDIRFLAFSLARLTQVISSYTCTTEYGQWTRHEIKKAG